MSNRVVKYEQADNVAILTLNRPKAYNTFTPELLDQLKDGLLKAENEETVHAIILTGSGTKAFCAGIDLKELSKNPGLFSSDKPILEAFANRKKPLIGAINGYCMTGGLELALFCDLLYASDNAVFSDTHTKVGIIPGWGMTQRLPRLIGPGRAKEMSLSAKKIDAQTALSWGLVNYVYSQEQLMPEAIKLANMVANNIPSIVSKVRSMIDKGMNMPLDEAIAYEYEISQNYNNAKDFSGIKDKLNEMRGKANK